MMPLDFLCKKADLLALVVALVVVLVDRLAIESLANRLDVLFQAFV